MQDPARQAAVDDVMAHFRKKYLPDAIKEQKRNDKIRRVCWWMIASCGIYTILAAIVSSYLEKKFGLQINDTGWEVVMISPAAFAGAIGFMGVVMYAGNSVMELTKVGDTYIAKNH